MCGDVAPTVPSVLKRSFDKAFLFYVVNHDDVFPSVSMGQPKPLELGFALEDERNIFLANDHGGFLFMKKGECLYEVHTLFLKSGRGPQVYAAAKEAANFMFRKTDAMIIATVIALNNAPAQKLAESVGFDPWGSGEVNGVQVDMFELSIKRWAQCQQE